MAVVKKNETVVMHMDNTQYRVIVNGTTKFTTHQTKVALAAFDYYTKNPTGTYIP